MEDFLEEGLVQGRVRIEGVSDSGESFVVPRSVEGLVQLLQDREAGPLALFRNTSSATGPARATVA